MTEFAPHPGTVRFVDLSRGTAREDPAETVPDAHRFVYRRDGEDVRTAAEATERIPIVLVEMMAMDDEGNLVMPEHATIIRIEEFGEDRRPLRTTKMVRDPTAPAANTSK